MKRIWEVKVTRIVREPSQGDHEASYISGLVLNEPDGGDFDYRLVLCELAHDGAVLASIRLQDVLTSLPPERNEVFFYTDDFVPEACHGALESSLGLYLRAPADAVVTNQNSLRNAARAGFRPGARCTVEGR